MVYLPTLNVGKYTSPVDPLGYIVPFFPFCHDPWGLRGRTFI